MEVLGELRALALEARELRDVADDRGRDHVDAAPEHPECLARNVLDPLAAPGEISFRLGEEVRRRDASPVVAQIGQQIARLGPHLVLEDVGDRRDAASGRRVRGDVLDGLALVEHLATVADTVEVLLGSLDVRFLVGYLRHSRLLTYVRNVSTAVMNSSRFSHGIM